MKIMIIIALMLTSIITIFVMQMLPFNNSPQTAQEWYDKGIHLYSSADPKETNEALQAFDKALKYNPKYAEAWCAKGNLLSILERNNEAIECYEKALESNPKYVDAWDAKGEFLAYIGAKNYEDAQKVYDEALKIAPKNWGIWFSKGLLSEKQYGPNEEAIEAYNKATEIKPDIYILNQKGRALKCLWKFSEAIQVYQGMTDKGSSSPHPWYNLATLYSLQNDRINAINNLAIAIMIDDTSPTRNRYKDMARADESFTSIRDSDEFKAIINTNDLSVLSNLVKHDLLLRVYNKMLENNPETRKVLFCRAVLYSLEKNKSACLSDLNKAINLNKDYKKEAITSSAFQWLREDEEFKKIVNK